MQRNRFRIRHLLMTTASATAMIVSLNSGAAAAGCIAVVAPASNSSVSDCILISGTGNVTNNLPGTISNTTTGGAASSTHAVAVTGTLSGQIQNNGTIISRFTHLPTLGPNPVTLNLINISGVVTGGISNNGLIEASGLTNAKGIYIHDTTSFGGGITNSSAGLIQAIGNLGNATAIKFNLVSTFSGGISNSGVITATGDGAKAIDIDEVSIFSGGITNSGTLSVVSSSFANAIETSGISSFLGGITNSGLISAFAKTEDARGIRLSSFGLFTGGILNTGTISATGNTSATGIRVVDGSTFSGGISNSGKIVVSSAASNAIGIRLGTGIATFLGGITNSGSITVHGEDNALGIYVDPSTFSGNIVNSGLLSVTAGTNDAFGIYVNNTSSFLGGITNSGTISVSSAGDTGFGIYAHNISTFTGSIVNSGLIKVTGASDAYGIYVGDVISFLGGITNSGTILASSSADDVVGIRVNFVSSFLGGITNSGLIKVSAADAATGIYVRELSLFAGGIANSGTIAVTAGNTANVGAMGIYVADVLTFSGNIVNSGLITVRGKSTANGIYVSFVPTFAGGITNSGTIQVTSFSEGANGIYVHSVSTFTGGITNSGTIHVTSLGGNANGIIATLSTSGIPFGTFLGGITNSGLIDVTGLSNVAGIYAASIGTFSSGISNSGTILGWSFDDRVIGIYASSIATFHGGITNSGLISLTGLDTAAGIYLVSVSTFLGGIKNSGTILATSFDDPAFGIYVHSVPTFSGGITNSGLIKLQAHSDAAGIYAHTISTFVGGITNSGTIIANSDTARAFGIFVAAHNTTLGAVDGTFLGGITNSGLINLTALDTAAGIYVSSLATFGGGITNSGTILATSHDDPAFGIYVASISTFTGGITNSGLISVSGKSSAFGIYATSISTFTGGISNSGTILATSFDDDAFGIYLVSVSTFTGGITNSGTIHVVSLADEAFGIYVVSVPTFTGNIVNSGLISVTANTYAAGIYVSLSTFSGGISNSGTVIASSLASDATGILVSVSTFSGGISNSGLISVHANTSAAGLAVVTSTFVGNITNSGTIVAVSDASSAVGINVLGSTFIGNIVNSGTIIANAAGSATGIFVAQSTMIGNIVNSGLIMATAHGSGTAFGIDVRVSSFLGGITNSGTILASSTGGSAYGIYVDPTTFAGGITNSGVILGSGGFEGNGFGIGLFSIHTFAGGITNSGTITGLSSGDKGFGIYMAGGAEGGGGTFLGGITNSGTIIGKGGVTGYGIYIRLSTFAGGITNSGLIAGLANTKLGKGVGIYFSTMSFTGDITNTGTIIGSSTAIDIHSVLNSVTINNDGGTILGDLKLSDTVVDTVNIDHGLVAGGISGADAVVNVLGTVNEITLGHKIGSGPVDGGTPILNYSLSSVSTLQIDVNAVPTDPTVDPAVSGNNGYLSAQTITINPGASFVAGVKPGDFNTTLLHPGETILYRDVLKATVAQTGLVTVAGTKGNFGAIYTTSGVFTAQLLPDDAASVTDPADTGAVVTDDLKLTFIGFGAGFVENGANGILGQTPNQRSTGHGVDTILDIPGARDLTSLLFAESGPQLLKDLDQLSGVQYAADFNLFAAAPIQTSDDVQTLLWARAGQLASAKAERQGLKLMASAGVSDSVAQLPPTGPSSESWSVWGRAYGVLADLKSQTAFGDPNNVPGFREHRYGGVIGADYTFNPNWLAGGFFNYSHSDVDFKAQASWPGSPGKTTLNNYQLGLYGQYHSTGPWYVNAIVTGGFGSFDSTRNIFSPIPAQAHGSYNGKNYGAYGEGGWDFLFGSPGTKVTPFIGVGYLHQTIDEFTETGAGLEDLVVKGDEDSLRTSLGARFQTRWNLENGAAVIPELRAVWEHEFLDQQQQITNRFAIGGGPFDIVGARVPRDAGVVGVGLTYAASPSWRVFADYDYKFQGDYTAHQISAGIKWTFGAAPPPPPPAPPPVPAAQPAPPPPAQAQVFVVYFDFDKSVLTPEAVGIIRQAADTFKRTGAVTVKVDGYTDLAGTARYNIGLSKRRADAVRVELVKDGVPANAVAEAWHGKTDPAVPTPDGVREPRNRRATIALP